VFRVTSIMRSPWLATVLLLAWLAPVVAPHAGGDDLLCEVPAAGSGAGSVRATVDDGGQPAHHCVICHSARSHRTGAADLALAAVVFTPGHAIAPTVVGARRAPALDNLPARAPPA
jgi:hypothetical protein